MFKFMYKKYRQVALTYLRTKIKSDKIMKIDTDMCDIFLIQYNQIQVTCCTI